MKNSSVVICLVAAVLFDFNQVLASPISTAFTYQGSLSDTAGRVTGIYDFQFKLFSDPNSTTQVGSTVSVDNISVSKGLFTEEMDFGSGVFNGQKRWIEVSLQGPVILVL